MKKIGFLSTILASRRKIMRATTDNTDSFLTATLAALRRQRWEQ